MYYKYVTNSKPLPVVIVVLKHVAAASNQHLPDGTPVQLSPHNNSRSCCVVDVFMSMMTSCQTKAVSRFYLHLFTPAQIYIALGVQLTSRIDINSVPQEAAGGGLTLLLLLSNLSICENMGVYSVFDFSSDFTSLVPFA